jgi:phage terminase small subunit
MVKKTKPRKTRTKPTIKQQKFIEAVFETGNKAEAARRA